MRRLTLAQALEHDGPVFTIYKGRIHEHPALIFHVPLAKAEFIQAHWGEWPCFEHQVACIRCFGRDC